MKIINYLIDFPTSPLKALFNRLMTSVVSSPNLCPICKISIKLKDYRKALRRHTTRVD